MKRQAYNPYLPAWEYIPDGEPRVFGDRLYIFGSHDRFGAEGYCENDYVAWSAPVEDLSDWRYEGVIFRKDQTPWNTRNQVYYAPDCVQGPDGRYYLYYFVVNSSIISVAVCDKPAGKYEYLGDVSLPDGHAYGTKSEEWFTFDPAVLVDDDGRIWLYTGSSQPENGQYGHEIKGCFVMELAADMLTVISKPQILLPAKWVYTEPNFFEGASIRHIGEWYYLVYPATNMTGLNYSMSRFPDRDFVHKGAIHCSSNIGYQGRSLMQASYPIGNSHGGLVCIKGQWYIFDHRVTNGSPFSRQGVAEKITIHPDGTIDMVESTSCGLNDGPLKGRGTYPAYIACVLMGETAGEMLNPMEMTGPCVTQDGPDYDPPKPEGAEINGETEKDAPVSYITGLEDGSQAGYKYFDMTNTRHLSVVSRGAGGKLEILNGESGEAVAEILLSQSDDWAVSETDFMPERIVAERTDIAVSRCPLFLRYQGEGSIDILEFTLS